MSNPYTIEQQEKVCELNEKITFFSWRLGMVGARDTLQQKVDDLMEYVDSVEKQRE